MMTEEPTLQFSASSELVVTFCFEFRAENRFRGLSMGEIGDFVDEVGNGTGIGSGFGLVAISNDEIVQTEPCISFNSRFRDSDKFPKAFKLYKQSNAEDIGIGDPGSVDGQNGPDNINRLFLTQYGVGIVRIRYKDFLDNNCTHEDYISEVKKSRTGVLRKKAKNFWQTFFRYWNSGSRPKIVESKSVVDSYTNTYVKNPNIVYRGEQYNICDIFNDENNGDSVPEHVRTIAKKKLIGMSNISTVWREYSKEHVENVLNEDLSATTNEIQLTTWKHGLFVRDEKGKHDETNFKSDYSNYFLDMVLGLELYLMMRASIQIMESRLEDEVEEFFDQNDAVANFFNPTKTIEYQTKIRQFDEWLVEIKEWKYISRHGLIQHFHDFLNKGYRNLRVDEWLQETEEKVNHLRQSHDVRSDRISTINSILLSSLVLIFTILLFINTII